MTLSGCQKVLIEVAKEWHESHYSNYEEEITHMHKAIEAMPEKQRKIFLKCFALFRKNISTSRAQLHHEHLHRADCKRAIHAETLQYCCCLPACRLFPCVFLFFFATVISFMVGIYRTCVVKDNNGQT